MARKVANLSFFILSSDYNPKHYYNWTEKELAALGDCKATGEVIKKRLEDNGKKVKEMYTVKHEGHKKSDSKPQKFHGTIDETKPHYHIVVRFEPSHGATLKEIAEYIGVPFSIVVKPNPGRYSYPNSLSYLTHIKDMGKIWCPPENVVTLAGTDYMDYFNEYKEMWERGREIKAKKGGKTLDRRFREAVKKLESGELSYAELFGIPEYHDLLPKGNYHLKLKAAAKRAEETAEYDFFRLCKEICNGKISKEEAKTLKEYEYAFKYYDDSHIDSMVLSMKGYQK